MKSLSQTAPSSTAAPVVRDVAALRARRLALPPPRDVLANAMPCTNSSNSYMAFRDVRASSRGSDAKSGCDAEGYAGCARRVIINQKLKPDRTNSAAG